MLDLLQHAPCKAETDYANGARRSLWFVMQLVQLIGVGEDGGKQER